MKKKKALNKDSTSWLVLTLTIFTIAVIPLLIRVSAVNYPLAYPWHPNNMQFYDIYALIKSNVIVIIGIISFLVLLYRQYHFKVLCFKDPIVISTLIFALTIVLSHLTSINTMVSSRGYLERYESTWVWLSYLSSFLAIYSLEWKQDQLKYLIKAFVISNVILSIIGIFQYIGVDLVFNSITKPFITAFNMMDINYSTEYSINYKVIIQTLYHYNYVGFYISLSFPIILSLLLNEKNVKIKLFYAILSTAILFNLLGSSARGGLVGIAFTMPFFIYFNRKILFKKLKLSISIVLILIVVFIGFETLSDNFVTKRLTSIFTSVSSPELISDISIHGDTINFDLNGNIFETQIVSNANNEWIMNYELNNKPIDDFTYNDNQQLVFNQPELKNLKIYLTNFNGDHIMTFDIQNTPWHFALIDNELVYINPSGKPDEIIKAESIGFENKEKLGSSRGYIWSRSLPLILDKPFLGYGVDTFALAFPQNDYIGKFKAYNTNNMIVDKAHNMLINIAINSGLIAVIAYISLFIFFIYRFLVYSGNLTEFNKSFTTSILLALISYHIASLFNDSSVMVSSVFWGIFAVGSSLLRTQLTQKYSK